MFSFIELSLEKYLDDGSLVFSSTISTALVFLFFINFLSVPTDGSSVLLIGF